MNHQKANIGQIKQANQTGFHPSEFMRARHPDLFSDSQSVSTIQLTQAQFEYHLETLTYRKQEIDFEYFCRRLAEKEICPNLLPQTGPLGGGDSQVDTETYPVADNIALRWYEGIGRESSRERWAFAFSAKKDWRAKVKSDVEKIVNTGREYQLINFITNQFVRDRTRVEVEENLKTKFGIAVRILDRSWIASRVFEHNHLLLAAETLKLPEVSMVAMKQVGPLDISRQAELRELEDQINDTERYEGIEYQLAEDCLEAALLARGLELPRFEVEGRFHRATQIADRVGMRQQKLRVAYNFAWTEYWWYEDHHEFNHLYNEVEKLVLGSEQADDVELLVNLWQILYTEVKHGSIGETEGALQKHTFIVKAELDRLASDPIRPNNALHAKTNRLLLNLTETIYQGNAVDLIFDELKDVLLNSEGLLEFPIIAVLNVIQEMGSFFPHSKKFDELLETIIQITEKRTSEGEAGRILVQRGEQKYQSGENYEAIKLLGRAQPRLAKEEYRSDWIEALVACGLAYEAVGLLWAARANILIATSQTFVDYIKSGKLDQRIFRYLNRLIWLELQLGRVPHVLAWMDFFSLLTTLTVFGDSQEEKYQEERSLQDQVLAILLSKSDLGELKWLGPLAAVLEERGLSVSWMTLLYILGHEEYLREEGLIPVEEDASTVQDLFYKLSTQPASKDIPDKPELLNNLSVNLYTPVLGCKVVINVVNNQSSLFLAENLAGALEAFLATSFDRDLIPYRSELRINIEQSEFLTGLPQYTINQKKQGEIIIRHPIKIPKENAEERAAYHKWLQKLITDIMFQITLIPNAKTFYSEVVENEQSFDRAILFSDTEITVTSLLGEHPRFQLKNWQNGVQPTIFPLLRSIPWNYGVKTEVEHTDSKSAITSLEGNPPESIFDMNKYRHKDRQIISLINLPLWNQAKWRGTAYVCIKGAVPILALCFENAEPANLIFQEWVDKLGNVDEKNQLRISIITGVNKNRPLDYIINVTSNINPFVLAGLIGKHVLNPLRYLEMSPQSQESMNYFLNTFNKVGRYILAPARFLPATGSFEPIGNNVIGMEHLKVHPAWQIKPNDLDYFAIINNVDSIISADENNPSISNDPPQATERKRRKRHK